MKVKITMDMDININGMTTPELIRLSDAIKLVLAGRNSTTGDTTIDEVLTDIRGLRALCKIFGRSAYKITIREVSEMDHRKLLSCPNVGTKTIKAINKMLEDHGYNTIN